MTTTPAREYFGDSSLSLTLNTGTTPTRNIHWHEAGIYVLQITAGASNLTARLPVDVRHERLGRRIIVVNHSTSTKSIDIKNGVTGSTLKTLAAGSHAWCVLVGNGSAGGVWGFLTAANGPKAALS